MCHGRRKKSVVRLGTQCRPFQKADLLIKDGLVDTGAMRPIARLGYMDYGVINPENVFSINRPEVGPDGKLVAKKAGAWEKRNSRISRGWRASGRARAGWT